MKILVGLTGSVATSLCFKLRDELVSRGHEVKFVATDRSTQFIEARENEWFETDADEFYKACEFSKGGSIKHIELRDWADLFLVAPCSANTLSKLANGLCDNLLTSVARAWDCDKPFYIAPAMNTNMWTHPLTKIQLAFFESFGGRVIWPTSNVLACGQSGIGAMSHVYTIANLIEGHRWTMPIRFYGHDTFIPEFPHPGAFGVTRAKYNHTGVDLYAPLNEPVSAVEDGIVIAIEPFTGQIADMPWWNDTWHVTVKGKSGLVVYGEIRPHDWLQVGKPIKRGHCVGYVLQVLVKVPENPPENHKPTMLHLELLYKDSTDVTVGDWLLGDQKARYTLDPTPYRMFKGL